MKLVLWLILAAVLACSVQGADDAGQEAGPIVTCGHGPVRGREEKSVEGRTFYSYRGIPFAQPPLGALRFKDPVPSGGWEGVLDGRESPSPCMQYFLLGLDKDDKSELPVLGQEDCLYLNVFTPAKPTPPTSAPLLPVMVFIHGGGFLFGSADDAPPYALLDKDIVLVVIQYRLSIFGFLSTEDEALPGNMGLRDQRLAIMWAKEHAQAFGGDPDRVTLFGESAGGASVHMHMLSPESQGLFHRVIAQSGTALGTWAFSEDHLTFAEGAAKAFDCAIDRGSDLFLECMQGIAAKFLMMHAGSVLEWGITPAYVIPRIDGSFFPANPEVMLREGNYNKVDFMTGVTRDEGIVWTIMMEQNPEMVLNLNSDFAHFGPLSLCLTHERDSEAVARRIYERYLGTKTIHVTEEDFPQLTKLYSAVLFELSYDLTSFIHSHDEEVSVFLYQLNHKGEHSLANFYGKDSSNYGIAHADDLFYLFEGGSLFARPLEREEDKEVRDIFLSAWTNFAATGNPTPPGSAFEWERATATSYKQLNLTPRPTMQYVNKNETRKFFLSLDLKQMNELLKADRFDLRLQDEGGQTKQEL